MHIQLHMHENPQMSFKDIILASGSVFALWPFTSQQVGVLFVYLMSVGIINNLSHLLWPSHSLSNVVSLIVHKLWI